MRKTKTKEKADKLVRLKQIEVLMVRGCIQSDIVRETKIPQQTVSRIMDEIKATWLKECPQSVEETKNRFLRENSGLREKLHKELENDESDVVRVVEAIGSIQTREMKLLGLDKRVVRIEDESVDFASMDDEGLDAYILAQSGQKQETKPQ